MRKTFSFLLLAIVVSGCNFAGTAERRPFNTPVADAITTTSIPTAAAPTLTVTPLPPSATPNLTPSDGVSPQPSATLAIFPVLTLAADAVCRAGPGERYFAMLNVSKGKSFEASGRNADGSWIALYASKVGDPCWVTVSSLESPDNLSVLRVLDVQPLPNPPANVTTSDNACGRVNNLWLYWYAIDAVGYRIYRNGQEIATVYGNKYRDLDTPRSSQPAVHLYQIEAFNASGLSGRTDIQVTICG